uniref:TonB-dependent receptor domain-containing protein n=1 Tax=Sphingobium sp. DC-2 TaxID=1303256 RepID=UPI0012DF29A0
VSISDLSPRGSGSHGVYGEIALPFVSPSNNVALVHRLNFTAAVRYEDVSHVGNVATPKLGFLYAPTQDIALKFSWGKSFKAPTHFQSGQPRQAYSQVGSTAFLPPSPSPGTVLYLVGGNSDLKPERATSWTATATLTPSLLEGLRIDASYFRINYRDRAVAPIPQNSLAFAPVYSAYVNLNPTREQVLGALANVSTLYDQGGGDPMTANVVAIITNYLQNAAIQRIDGADITVDYKFQIGSGDQIHLN